jgi:hypothetical protein
VGERTFYLGNGSLLAWNFDDVEKGGLKMSIWVAWTQLFLGGLAVFLDKPMLAEYAMLSAIFFLIDGKLK